MMPLMFSRALRGGIAVLAAFLPLTAASAHAATLPAHAEIGAGKYLEPADFRKLVAIRYDVEFNQVVAADIDRDGDIDVLATTDHTFTVWVNDGAGHLTRQVPAQPRQSGAGPSAPSLGDRQSNTFVSIQNDSHVADAVSGSPRPSPPAQPYRLELSAAAVSASPGALRSRSPPASLRLS
jgi:hypothetical protein